MSRPGHSPTPLTSARAHLLRDSAVTDGFTGVDVQAADRHIVAVFRWRLDPSTYTVRVRGPGHPPLSPWTGLPAISTEQWAADLAGLLMEELDTGLVRRARRTASGDVVELHIDDAPDRFGDDYYVSRVPLDGEAGRWLETFGMDVSWPRAELAAERLLSWLMVCENNERGEPLVGQVATAWEPDGTAVRLGVLHVAATAPERVGHALAHHAVHDAAEAGARRVVTACGGAGLAAAGFTTAPDGISSLLTGDAGWYH